MSASNQPEDLDDPSKYAPKWFREGQAKQHTAEVRRLPTAPQLVVSDEPSGGPGRWDNDPPFEGDLAIKRMRIQRSLEPERVSEPEWTQPSSFPFGMLVRASVAIAIAILGALAYVGELPIPFGRTPQGTVARETIGSDLRFAVPAENSRASASKMADRVGDARAQVPPAGDTGPARAEAAPKAAEPAEPRRGNQIALASVGTKPWPDAPAPTAAPSSPAPTAAPAPVAAPPAPPPAAPVVRHLAPEEIETLIQRGEAFISQGDISAARLMLKRAAEAGNARAALALGATYDPEVLRKMGVLGFPPDAALAREWYQKAAALGSGEAARRLAGIR